ncbi:MAG: hypothetical protein EB084_18390 [Proteobacteria bacterium]|nr:hypothetical protein [Pseudomonadota bacterium]
MPTFKLVPLLMEPCPSCKTDIHVPFAAGRQQVACSSCSATLSFELPARAVADLLDRVKQVETALDDAINRR